MLKNQFPVPTIYETSKTMYPFPIPQTELYPEHNWPKSLCTHAPECPIPDDYAEEDLVGIRNCLHAFQEGCPLFITQFAEHEEFGECKRIPIFEIGQVESKSYTEKDLDKIIENFDKLKDTHRPPMIVLGHGEDQAMLKKSGLPSAGWVNRVFREGKQLFADFMDVPKKVVTLLRNKAYRFPSVEIYRNFMFNEENFGPVLRRVALLGADIPRIKSLDDILARYEEDVDKGTGNFVLPVRGSKARDKDEILWLGGKSMDKINVPIKSFSGTFTAGEELLKGDAVIGTFEEITEDSLVILADPKAIFETDDEISGKDSEAKATVGKFEEKGKEFKIPIKDLSGLFKEDEDVFGDDPEFFAKVKKVEPDTLIIYVLGDKKFKIGEIITGKTSKATARVGKVEKKKGLQSPYPVPEKSAEALIKLQERLDALEEENTSVKADLILARNDVKNATKKIEKVEADRFQERTNAHTIEVDKFFETLAASGLAPAIIGDGGLKAYSLTLDWEAPIKFGEDQDEKTQWTKFSEILESMINKNKENKLFVPLDEFGKVVEDEDIVGEGIDTEGAKMDAQITKFMEEKGVTYEEAYRQYDK